MDASKWEGKFKPEFKDFTFEAKNAFGASAGQGGDSYGQWSSDKLIKVVGKNFVKEKNKMKNRQTHQSGTFD